MIKTVERRESMKSKQTRATVAGMLTVILLGAGWVGAAAEGPAIKLQKANDKLQIVTDADAPTYYLEYRTATTSWQPWTAGQTLSPVGLWFRAVFASGDVMVYEMPADVTTFYAPSSAIDSISNGQSASTIGSINPDGTIIAIADRDVAFDAPYTPPTAVLDIPARQNNQAHATPMPGSSQLIWRDTTTSAIARWDLADTSGNEFTVRSYDNFRLLPDMSAVTLNTAWTLCGVASLDNDLELNDMIWQNTSSGSFALWRLNPDPTIAEYGTIQFEPTPSSGIWSNVVLQSPWRVVGIASLNGDGKKNDVIWQNPISGLVARWEVGADGRISSYTTIQYFDSVSNAWRDADLKSPWTLGAIGDFNGDGTQDDLIWHNPTTGRFASWKLGSDARVSSFGLIQYEPTPGAWTNVILRSPWEIVGISELDGDGKLNDVIWHLPTQGIVARWDVATNGQVTAYGQIKYEVNSVWQNIVLRSPWTMRGVVSIGGDDKLNSLVWHNPTTGRFACWRLTLSGSDTRISNFGSFALNGSEVLLTRPWEITDVRGN